MNKKPAEEQKQGPEPCRASEARCPQPRAIGRDSCCCRNDSRCSGQSAQTPGCAGEHLQPRVERAKPTGGPIAPERRATGVDTSGVWQGKDAHVVVLMNWSSWGPPLLFPLAFKKIKRSGVPVAQFRDCFRSSS